MRLFRTPNPRLGIGLWMLVLIASLWQLFRVEVPRYPNYHPPIVEATEQRLLPVRQVLGEELIIGYVSDSPPYPPDIKGQAAYYLTQYTLAPTLVDRDGQYPLVIVHLLFLNEQKPRLSRRDWESLGEFEDGILLLRRKRP